jgi:hypothetical protein
MAVKTVTNANLTDYVAERQAKGSNLAAPGATSVEATPAPKTGVVASGAETKDAPPEPTGGEPSAKAKSDKEKSEPENPFRERIKELTDRVKDTEEFAQGEYEGRLSAQKRISELEAELKRLKPPEQKPEEPKPPDHTKFANQSEYDEAVKKYQNAIIDARVKELREYERALEREEKLKELLDAKAQEAGKEIEDFWDVVKSQGPRAPAPPPHVQAALQEWDTGVKIAYHLVKHPDEAKRIYAMTPGKALEALIPLAQKYAKPQAEEKAGAVVPPDPAPTTRAPAPMSAIKPTTETVPQDLSSPMPFTDYRSRRMAQIKQRRQEGRK